MHMPLVEHYENYCQLKRELYLDKMQYQEAIF